MFLQFKEVLPYVIRFLVHLCNGFMVDNSVLQKGLLLQYFIVAQFLMQEVKRTNLLANLKFVRNLFAYFILVELLNKNAV